MEYLFFVVWLVGYILLKIKATEFICYDRLNKQQSKSILCTLTFVIPFINTNAFGNSYSNCLWRVHNGMQTVAANDKERIFVICKKYNTI